MRKTLFIFIAALLYSAAAVSQVLERLVGVTPQELLMLPSKLVRTIKANMIIS